MCMPEGVIEAGRVVDEGVPRRGQRPPEPPPDPTRAPLGWTYDRGEKSWRPARRRGRRPGGTRDDGRPVDAAEPPPERDPEPVAEQPWRGGGWQAERDPEPAHLLSEGDVDVAVPMPEITADVKQDLLAMMGLLGTVVLPIAVKADPYCGTALANEWEPISRACLPLLCQSPRVVSWMTSASGMRNWIGLAIALRPVGVAVVQHHITRSVRVEQTEQGPRAVQEDWSAYAA